MSERRGFTPSCLQYRRPMSIKDFALTRIMDNGSPYSFATVPYFLDVCDALDDEAGTCRVVVMSPAQIGKSEMELNFIGKTAIYNPQPTLVIMDTSQNSRTFSATRLRPFLRRHCKLECFEQQAAGNDVEKSKSVTQISLGQGATLLVGGSRSASDLCSRAVAYLALDELDRFATLPGEGDSVSLALKRMMRFRKSMALLTSTPTTTDGKIYQYFTTGTQRVWCAKCHCGALMDVDFFKLSWDNPDEPTWACESCGEVYTEMQVRALPHEYAPPANGEPFSDRFGRACESFSIHGELCSAFYTWKDLRTEYRAALKIGEGGVRSFVNTVLGRVYTPESERVMTAEDFAGPTVYSSYGLDDVPSWVKTVCAGIDTQDSLFAVQVVGFNEDGQRVAVLQRIDLLGSLAEAGGAVWRRLVELVVKWTCQTADGRTLPITFACMDSGGHFTQSVYGLSLACPRIRAIKGRSYKAGGTRSEVGLIDRIGTAQAYVGTTRTKVPLIWVGTIYAKDRVYAMLREVLYGDSKEKPIVFPDDPALGCDDRYFGELVSNMRVDSPDGSHSYVLPQGMHDESLDTLGYAMAAFELLRQFQGRLPSVPAMKDAIGERADVARAATAAHEAEDAQRLATEQSAQSARDAVTAHFARKKRC